MISNIRDLIWLCWILSSLLSLALCEPNEIGAGSESGPGKRGSLGFLSDGGHASFEKDGASNPYEFGQDSRHRQTLPSDNDNSGRDSTPRLSGEVQQQQDYTRGGQATPLLAALAPPATSTFLSNPVALAPLVTPISATTSPIIAQPYGIEAADEYYSSPPAILGPDPTPFASIAISSSEFPSSNTITIAQPLGTITRTRSLTITIPAVSGSATTNINPDPTTTLPATAAPALDLAPIPTSPGTMSASAKAGMGIGITFGVLSFASAAGLGFYLWRRKRNARHLTIHEESGNTGAGGLGGLFSLKRWKHASKKENGDAEWSIESASQVEIVRGANARTVSRGSSTTNTPPVPNFNTHFPPADIDISAAPRGRLTPPPKLHNLALTSNPPSLPRLDEFPSPLSSADGDSLHIQNERRTNSWPLQD